jgi:hypothetical protein
MSAFRSLVLSIEVAAKANRIRLPMSKLRDAIAVALVNRTYAAARAAEAANVLPAIVLPPPHLDEACTRYGLDPLPFAAAFASHGAIPAAKAPEDGLQMRLTSLLAGKPAPLYLQPGRAYVELEEDGTVSAGCDPDVGSGVPIEVWNGVTRRFKVSPFVSGAALHAYLTGPGRRLLATIHAGHEVEWDGSNRRGSPTSAAAAASDDLKAALEELDTVAVWGVDEFLFGANALRQVWTDECLDTLCVQLEAEACAEGIQLEGEVRAALLTRAREEYARNPERLDRHIVRALVQEGDVSLGQYAEWITAYDDGADVTEAAKDVRLRTPVLWINDAQASTAEIERGRDAALALLQARDVAVVQAYLARAIDACGGQTVPQHLEAWLDAQHAAFTAAFDGWARWPEGAVLELG